MIMGPVFLSLADVLEIHRDQIERYGGTGGIRDINGLKSAIGMPAATFGGVFLHEGLTDMAGAYLFHLVQNHPFLDGNKRTGTMAAIVFLDLNGFQLEASEDSLYELVMGLAAGQYSKADVLTFMKRWVRSSR